MKPIAGQGPRRFGRPLQPWPVWPAGLARRDRLAAARSGNAFRRSGSGAPRTWSAWLLLAGVLWTAAEPASPLLASKWLRAGLSLSAPGTLATPEPVSADQPRRDPGRVPPPRWTPKTLDVFLPDARRVLPAGAGRPATPSNAPRAASAQRGDRSGEVWSRRISPEALEDEVKTTAIRLQEALSSEPRFNSGGFRDARRMFHLLAVWFAVAQQHDGSMRWKGPAGTVSRQMAATARQAGEATAEAYRAARQGQGVLMDLIRGTGGGQHATAKEPPAWERLSPRTAPMQRLEEGWQERLRPWLADPATFRRHRSEVRHEAQIAAALARVVQGEGYPYADEAEYGEWARQLEAAAGRLTNAARHDDFDQARRAGTEMGRTCSECHAGFRG